MEKIEGGELFDKVIDAGGLSEDVARNCFRQILQAMAYCHGRGVAHRDMKLENIILTKDQNCKVCDFGLAKNINESAASTVIGTGKYVAPDVLGGGVYDAFKADMWSCGVILYCMTQCAFPFTKAGNDGVGGEGQYKATASDLRLLKYLKEAKVTLKKKLSPEFEDFLLKGLLNPNTEARLSAAGAKRIICTNPAVYDFVLRAGVDLHVADALKHPWVLGADWTAATVDEILAVLDTEAAVVPGNYSNHAAWTAKVQELAGRAPLPEPDDDEGF